MSSRIDYTLKNARWTILFSVVLLVLNFFSRSVFIDYLGSELVGLTSVVTSYVGFLNLAEMGIGVAITQALYKPVYDDDRAKVNEIVSLIGYLFRWVGIVIACGGTILAFFLPTIFENSGIATFDIFFAFGAMMFTTLLSYFVNYRQTIVIATQRSYAITKIQNTTMVVKVILQMALLLWLERGYVSWLVVEMVFGVIYAIWLDVYIKRNFGWLQTSIKLGKVVAKTEKTIFKNIKHLFQQGLASKVLLQSDNIVIQNVISVVEVAYYTNYVMLVQRATMLVTSVLSNSHASVGNLVASNDREKQKLVYWQYNALFFWIAGIVAFGFFEMINPFINLWLKDKVIYSETIVLFLSVNLFIGIARRPNEYFLSAYGLFGDVWAAWTELILNLTLSIILAINYGVVGVVIGTAVSTGLNTFVWKPYYLYSRGFKNEMGTVARYWGNIALFVGIIIVVGCATHIAGKYMLTSVDTWSAIAIRTVVVCAVFTIITLVMFYIWSKGMRSLVKLGLDIAAKRTSK